MTNEEYANIGKAAREAEDGNIIVGSFAAELVGESYPFSKTMANVAFNIFDDEQLGRKFVDWMDRDGK